MFFKRKMLVVPERDLERMLSQWPRPLRAEYRFARCWGCGRTLFFGMWHVFFRFEQREAHLCRKCGKPYEL